MPRRVPLSIEELLADYSHPADDRGCRLFRFALSRGYGSMRWHGKQTPAHRVSYELAFGHIPTGMMICHHCDVPQCIEPTHLFLGTALDNVLDMVKKGRAVYPPRLDICSKGHSCGFRVTASGERVCSECKRALAKQLYWENREKVSAARKARNAAKKAYWDQHWAAIAAERENPN